MTLTDKLKEIEALEVIRNAISRLPCKCDKDMIADGWCCDSCAHVNRFAPIERDIKKLVRQEKKARQAIEETERRGK